MREEEKRKVRIAAGGLQSIWRLRPLLNPFRYGTFCFQYISHRVLRWSLTPILLFLLLPLNTILIFTTSTPLLYAIIWLLQALFYLMGSWGVLPFNEAYKKQDTFHPLLFPLHERQRHTRIQLPAQAQRQCKRRMGEGQKGMKLIL